MNIPIFPLYRLKKGGETSNNLAELLSKSDTLTFNVQSFTGFNEVEIVPILEKIPEQYKYLTKECEKTYKNHYELIRKLQSVLCEVMHDALSVPGQKVIFMSGGADSRIVAWAVKDVERKCGTALTNDVTFVCHHDEGEVFKDAMKQIGFNKKYWHVHKEADRQDADYYDLYNFNLNMNSFDCPAPNFWSEVVKEGEEKDTTIISGSFGGELLSYPTYKKECVFDNRYKTVAMWFTDCGFANAHMTTLWKSVFMPFLSWRYLDVAFRIDQSLYKHYDRDHGHGSIDNIRRCLLNAYGDTIPCHVGHNYNFLFSKPRAKYIRDKWINSKFYQHFKHIPLIANAHPEIERRGSLDSKLYGLATCFETTTL